MGTYNFLNFLCKELTSIHEFAPIAIMLDAPEAQVSCGLYGGTDAANYLST